MSAFWENDMEKQSLTVRFNILLVGSVLLCGLLLGAFFLVTLRATLIEGLNRSGREIASALGAVIASDILLDDRFTISDQLERTLEKNPEVRYILVTYPDGRILASTFPDGLPEGLLPLREKTDTEPHIYRSTEGPIREILYPIDDGITGYLRIGLTEREARALVERRGFELFLVLLLLALLATFLATRYAKLLGVLQQKERLRLWLIGQLFSAREDERRRISRELHDETSQSMVSILAYLRILHGKLVTPEQRELLQEARELTNETLQGLKRLAVDLHPPLLEDLGLIIAIEKYIDTLRRTHEELSLHLEAHGDFAGLDRTLALVAYRSVQEGLTNIVRHAGACHAEVKIRATEEALNVEIADDGVGFHGEAAEKARLDRHLGLVSMKERAELLDGSFTVESAPGAGTRLFLHLPRKKESGGSTS